jgi:hypothetical protein
VRNRDRILGFKISTGLLKSGSENRNQHTSTKYKPQGDGLESD